MNSQKMDLSKISDKLIFVNIKNSYEAMVNNDRNNPMFRDSLYDCTRKYWCIADEKAHAATHILGCYKGRVIEVIRIEKIYVESFGELSGRKVFEGKEQPDSLYMNWDLHELFDTLANFHTKYWGV